MFSGTGSYSKIHIPVATEDDSPSVIYRCVRARPVSIKKGFTDHKLLIPDVTKNPARVPQYLVSHGGCLAPLFLPSEPFPLQLFTRLC